MSLSTDQRPGSQEDIVKHRLREFASERVLLTGVERSQHGPGVVQLNLQAVPEYWTPAVGVGQLPHLIKGQTTQSHDDSHLLQQLPFSAQENAAVHYLLGVGFV
jgi:hypothetical protein